MSATLIHLSDFHLGRSSVRDRRAVELVDRLISRFGNLSEKPWIVVTGDVVNDGREFQYAQAASLLMRLRAAGFPLFLVPGNHDYGRQGNRAKPERLALFQRYLLESPGGPSYPMCVRPPGWALVGLDSMQAECGFWDGLFADGELGARQQDSLRRLVTELQPDRQRGVRVAICLHHHPFPYPDDGIGKRLFERAVHALKDGNALMDILDGKVDAILYGHEHRHVDFRRDFPDADALRRVPVVLSCGSTTGQADPAGWILRLNEVSVAVESLSL